MSKDPLWQGDMVAHKHGSYSRKPKPCFLHLKYEAERTNWKSSKGIQSQWCISSSMAIPPKQHQLWRRVQMSGDGRRFSFKPTQSASIREHSKPSHVRESDGEEMARKPWETKHHKKDKDTFPEWYCYLEIKASVHLLANSWELILKGKDCIIWQ